MQTASRRANSGLMYKLTVINQKRNLARRLSWATLCVGHTVWLIRSLSVPESSASRNVTLALAIVFLGLKVLDVAWLRFATNRRATVAGTLIVTLLHVGVIHDMAGGDIEFIPWAIPVVVATTLLQTQRLPRWFHRWSALYVDRLSTRILLAYWSPVAFPVGAIDQHRAAPSAPRAPPRTA